LFSTTRAPYHSGVSVPDPPVVIAGRFEIDRLAGSGGMGAVYRAWDRETGAVVALKVISAGGSGGAERFSREAQLLSSLDHAGIVRFVAQGATERGEPYLAMEWLEGKSLQERLAGGVLQFPETLRLGVRMCEILAMAHDQGIVHRDLKPGNVFLVDGSIDRIKLLDFGIAHVKDATQALTATDSSLGTPGYMPPEQIRSARNVDARADLYALGAVLFRCLTGVRPFEGETALELLLKLTMEPTPRLSSLRPDAPADLDELVARLLAKEPAERPATARETGKALAAISLRLQHTSPVEWQSDAALPRLRGADLGPPTASTRTPASFPGQQTAVLSSGSAITQRQGVDSQPSTQPGVAAMPIPAVPPAQSPTQPSWGGVAASTMDSLRASDPQTSSAVVAPTLASSQPRSNTTRWMAAAALLFGALGGVVYFASTRRDGTAATQSASASVSSTAAAPTPAATAVSSASATNGVAAASSAPSSTSATSSAPPTTSASVKPIGKALRPPPVSSGKGSSPLESRWGH
jgi:serine/threonine protein kinase